MAESVHDLEKTCPALGGRGDKAGPERMCAELLGIQTDLTRVLLGCLAGIADASTRTAGTPEHGTNIVCAIQRALPSTTETGDRGAK
jgi:hypothetical protein